MAVPYTFATATSTIPLSQLDANFTYITTNYPTSASVAATYLTQANAASTYATKANPIFSGEASVRGTASRFSLWNGASSSKWEILNGFSSDVDGVLAFYDRTNTRVVLQLDQSGIVTVPIGQIKFPATQNPSADANTLDDYEEGTFVPSVGGNATYTTQAGTYTKIGRAVTFQAQLVINTIGTGSATTISGLPFTSSAISHAISVGYFANAAGAFTFVSGYINPGASQIVLTGIGAAGVSMTAGASVLGNSTNIVFSGTYYV